jgi:AraC-like DNA-binding protein
MEPLYFKIPRSKEESVRVEYWDLNFFFDPIHFHEDCQLTYILEGDGQIFIGDTISEFTTGEAFFIGKNIPHVLRNYDNYYNNSNLHARAISVFFSYDTLMKIFTLLPEANSLERLLNYSAYGIKLHGEVATQVYKSVNRMLNLKNFDCILELMSILNTISKAHNLRLISTTSIPLHSVSEDNKKITTVFEFVMANFHEKISLNEISSKVNMSPTAFCRFFKQRTLKTFSNFLIEVRIGNACKMLAVGDYNTTQCCFSSGYNNVSNFHRHFRRVTGMTPSEYKQKIQKQPLAVEEDY